LKLSEKLDARSSPQFNLIENCHLFRISWKRYNFVILHKLHHVYRTRNFDARNGWRGEYEN